MLLIGCISPLFDQSSYGTTDRVAGHRVGVTFRVMGTQGMGVCEDTCTGRSAARAAPEVWHGVTFGLIRIRISTSPPPLGSDMPDMTCL